MDDGTSTRKRRLSLTKSQRADGLGAELLALLREVVDDGHLSDDEIARLKDWLHEHREADLPAVAHLAEAVERVLVDGVIEPEEREYLLDTIETVLPPDARKVARAQRHRASQAPRKCQADACPNLLPDGAAPNRKWCDECRDVRAAPNAYRDGDVAGLDVGFKVAGVSFDGRQDVIRNHVHDGDALVLVRDARNAYDSNAVQVRLSNGMQIGFVPREWRSRRFDDEEEHTNVEVASCLDAGLGHSAHCWKVLKGGTYLGVFAVAKFEGRMQPHPARVQLARERPESGLAMILDEQARRPATTRAPTPPPLANEASAPEARLAEQQKEPTRGVGRTVGLLLAVLLLAILVAVGLAK